MFVNSIDLHNNLKNELPRIRQGQTCFSVCHDARSMSLIRVVVVVVCVCMCVCRWVGGRV